MVDSIPVECGRSHETAKRSELVGFAGYGYGYGYGYCASHSRYFWGLRLHLHLVCTPAGLPVTFALASPKADERDVLGDLLEVETHLLSTRPGRVILADKGYASKELETFLADHGATLLRPARRDEKPRPGARLLKPLRQIIQSVNDTSKGQLDREGHGGRTPAGVVVQVLQRLLAPTATIWHNYQIGARPVRSLIAYDHGPLGIDHLDAWKAAGGRGQGRRRRTEGAGSEAEDLEAGGEPAATPTGSGAASVAKDATGTDETGTDQPAPRPD